MKILIGVATYPTEPVIYAETRACLAGVVRAGRAAGHAVWLRMYGEPHPSPPQVGEGSGSWSLLAKHRRMREEVLAGTYEALMTIEADMLVPADAVERLVAVDRDVAYGTYCSRRHTMVLCFPEIEGFTGRSISADPRTWGAHLAAGTVVPSEGVGFGCTLIRREVLEAVDFRRDDEKAIRRGFADDWFFALDVKAAGFRSAHDLGLVCGHLMRDGNPLLTSPRLGEGAVTGVLWPDAETPRLVRVEERAVKEYEVVTTFKTGMYPVLRQIWHAGESRYYAPGEMIRLAGKAAEILTERRAVGPMLEGEPHPSRPHPSPPQVGEGTMAGGEDSADDTDGVGVDGKQEKGGAKRGKRAGRAEDDGGV